jgi:serine O-acetyltransferase
MKLAINRLELDTLVGRQISNMFLLSSTEHDLLRDAIEGALERTRHCFAHTDNKYYRRDGVVYFNPFHAAQYCIFLYFLSREVRAREADPALLADRVYYLNRALNSVDLFYEVELPSIFMLDHPLGSVMGRAKYGDYFRFAQNCTVGNNNDLYPEIGRHVTMMSGSKIIGRSRIGDGVILAANSYVKDQDVPSDSTVFGASPNLIIKPRRT